MTESDPIVPLFLAVIALAWRVLGVGELIRLPRRRRSRKPYDPTSRPWGKGW